MGDPDEECYYWKHVDHAVIYIHVYTINLIQQSSTTSVVELGIHIPPLFMYWGGICKQLWGMVIYKHLLGWYM